MSKYEQSSALAQKIMAHHAAAAARHGEPSGNHSSLATTIYGMRDDMTKSYPSRYPAFDLRGFERVKSTQVSFGLPKFRVPSWLRLPLRVSAPLLLVQAAGLAIGLTGHPLLGIAVMFGTWLLASPWWAAGWWSARLHRVRVKAISQTDELLAWHVRYNDAIMAGLGPDEACARADQGLPPPMVLRRDEHKGAHVRCGSACGSPPGCVCR